MRSSLANDREAAPLLEEATRLVDATATKGAKNPETTLAERQLAVEKARRSRDPGGRAAYDAALRALAEYLSPADGWRELDAERALAWSRQAK